MQTSFTLVGLGGNERTNPGLRGEQAGMLPSSNLSGNSYERVGQVNPATQRTIQLQQGEQQRPATAEQNEDDDGRDRGEGSDVDGNGAVRQSSAFDWGDPRGTLHVQRQGSKMARNAPIQARGAVVDVLQLGGGGRLAIATDRVQVSVLLS